MKNSKILVIAGIILLLLIIILVAVCPKGKEHPVPLQEPVAAGPQATTITAQAVLTPGEPLKKGEKEPKQEKTAAVTKPASKKSKSTGAVNIKDYEFRISTDKTKFEVLKKGEVILTKEAGDKESFQVGADTKEKELPKAGADLTGDGKPDMILKTKSEKDSCSNVYSLFAVGEDMALLAEIKGLSDGIEFKDQDGDKIPELIGKDCTFLDWWAALGKPPAPKVILRYLEGSGYVLADDLMRKDPPETSAMQAYADKCKGAAISKVWSYMLDLIYTGNGDAAWKFYDMVEWNSDWEAQATDNEESKGKGDKQEYMDAFKEHLSTSPYWPAIKKLNNWEYSEMGM